jgi:serine/threonine-protein kinase
MALHDERTERVERIGRYVVERPLGKGGMGEVFLARLAGPGGFDKKVVVKRIIGGLVRNPKFVQMFLREARLLAHMNHLNIVQVLDVDQDHGAPFLAMEYVDGINAQELARRSWSKGEHLPSEVVLRIVADAALGLDYAHAFADGPLVHRDISPDNLLVSKQGVTKIIDFGLAKAEDGNTQLTNPGEIRGKLVFMSPEHANGDTLDGRADLWSLGVTAYWMLTAQLPFMRATTGETVTAIMSEPAEAPSKARPDLDPRVERLVLSLLEKEPARRPARGKQVHDEIIALLGPDASHHVTAALAISLIEARDDGEPSLKARPSRPSASAPLVSAVLIDTRGASTTAPNRPRIIDSHIAAWLAPAAAALVAAGLGALVPLPPPARVDDVADATAHASPPHADLVDAAGRIDASASAHPSSSAHESPSPATTRAESVPATSTQDTPRAASPPASATHSDSQTGAPRLLSKSAGADVVENVDAAEAKPAAVEASVDEGARRPRAKRTTHAVELIGPSSVSWSSGGVELGRGRVNANVAAGASVVAREAKRGVTTTIVDAGAHVDYATLPTGKLDVRAKPYANVSIGSTAVGQTPFEGGPITVVAGSVRVTLELNGQKRVVDVVVPAGGVGRVAVDMSAR